MSFTCQHCGMPQIITKAASDFSDIALDVGRFAEATSASSLLGIRVNGVRCANDACSKLTVNIIAGTWSPSMATVHPDSIFTRTAPYPGLSGKPFPQFVPSEILEDYHEAWAILNLSPKSSATLARRCLQAMIRDFCQIRENSLFAEIGKLKQMDENDSLPKGVEAETIEAMDALREIGNIGAHMRESAGAIVTVESGESEALLALIEMLFSDWYVARGKRREKLAAIKQIGEDKK